MKCHKCDTTNPDDSKFCRECGAFLEPLKDVSVTKTLQTPQISSDKTVAGKYKILSEIGRGGMGIVYKAKDIKLKRNVALKFLPTELMQDKQAKARFFQEAQAAAALNHPNICIIHEVDEADDQIFIVMEFIEGQTLKDRIASRALEIDEAVKIVTQIGEGLKEAHAKGIVHRDIKPANIMLTDKGTAKVMDFGIAKLAAGVDLTKPSTLIGTVAYMSPEQARGDEIDLRTDIWSLGAMFYEMLTGEMPFQKSQEQALIYSILNDKPTPVSLLRSEIPIHLERVIEKTLAKKPSERYQDIQELILNLKLSIPFSKTEKSIMVLPFENLSPDPDQEYFCDGMTEEIISDLSQIHSMRVISRNTAMVYKGTRKATKIIGQELNIRYVLEGSVRKAGDNLRITAQLIDAENDTHLWAEKYIGTLDDVFAIQEKVSRSIADALKLKLTSDEKKKLGEQASDDIRAYDCYLKAREEINKLTEEGMARAYQLIKTGMRIIGENELFYNALGYYYVQKINALFEREENHFKKAEECVDKIFSLNPESWYGQYLRGFINWKRGNVQESVKNMKQALIINPANPDVLNWLGYIYGFSGKSSAGIPLIKKAIEIDPLFSLLYALHAVCLVWDGKFELALQSAEIFIDMEPENPFFRFCAGLIFLNNRRIDDACEFFNRAAQDTPQDVFGKFSLLYKSAIEGDKNKVLELATSDIKKMMSGDEALPLFLATCYALIDEKKEAIDWIEEAVKWGFINYPYLNEYDPHLENIRREPGFKELMKRVKHEWENFEV